MPGDMCQLCGQNALHKCSACLSVWYCSREHQKLHWKKHKPACNPFEIVELSGLGRCLVARRDIQAQEVVLRERALVSGPAQVTGPVCLGCHNALTGPALECPKCGWPVCSLPCAASVNHRPECQWTTTLRKNKVKISNFVTPHPTYGCILPLRVLHARSKDPELWSKLSSLESHNKLRQEDGKWDQERFAVAGLLKRFFHLGPQVSEEDILNVCGIIQINGHEVPLSEPGYISVYWQCSLLEHSCLPNCSKSFTDSGEVVIRAAAPIPAGHRLSICYTDPLWGTPSRLHHLTASKYFICGCPRCRDPTELGTYFSAITCPQKCRGGLLPASFTDVTGLWRCDACGSQLEAEEVSERLSKAATALGSVEKQSPASLWAFLCQDLGLTENHYHRVEAKLALAQLVGQVSGGLNSVSQEWLQRKEHLVRELLALASILVPAECRLRGILYFELQAVLAERARRDSARNNDTTSVHSQLLETRKYLEEAINQLKYETQLLPEGKVCKQAVQNLKDLDRLLTEMNTSIMAVI